MRVLQNDYDQDSSLSNNFDKLINETKISNIVYTELIKPKINALTSKRQRWEQRLGIQITENEFCRHFANVTKVTIATKFRDFQFRLLHGAIITNTRLFQWNMKPDQSCSFCGMVPESTLHLFCECPSIAEIWSGVREHVAQNAASDVVQLCDWSHKNIIFNLVHPKPGHIINLLIVVTKQFIYRQRCLNAPLFLPLLIQEYEHIYNIE